ncbi:MAG: class I SAM-dependent methyltransferase, partial [Steroidobacter sp.]
SARSVIVLSEGLLMYLDPQVVNDLADDLRKMGNIHYWIQDYYSGQMRDGRMRPWRERMKAAPFKFQPADWLHFFTSRHWQVAERILLADEARRLGRRPPFPWWRMLMFMLTLPSIRKRMQERAGYGMFKPEVL